MFLQLNALVLLVLVSSTNACIGLGGGGCCSAPQCAPQVPRCSYSAPSYGGSYAQPSYAQPAPSYVSANLGSSYAQPAPSYINNAPLPAPSPSEYPTKG